LVPTVTVKSPQRKGPHTTSETIFKTILIIAGVDPVNPNRVNLTLQRDREEASSMVTAGATANITPRRGTVAHLGNRG